MAHFKNKSELAKLKPPDVTGDIWCTDKSGFGIRIGAIKRDKTFQKTYLARWRDAKGADQKKRVGEYSELTYEAAKAKSAAMIADAKAVKNEDLGNIDLAPTLKEAFEAMVAARRVGWKDTTLPGYDSRFKNLSTFFHVRIDKLGTQDWYNLYRSNAKTHGPAAALAAHSLGSIIYTFFAEPFEARIETMTKYMSPFNPCANLATVAKHRGYIIPAPVDKDRFIPAEKMPIYWATLQGMNGAARDYIMFGLFTGFRQSLLGALAWDRLDLDKRLYRVDANDKGNKGGVEFHFPIPKPLWERVIGPRLAMRRPADIWIIESPRQPGTPLHSVRGTHKGIANKTGIVVSDHDLRKSFGSLAHYARVLTLDIQRLLSHSMKPKNRKTAMTERYIKTTEIAFRDAVEQTAQALIALTKLGSGVTGKLPAPDVDYEDELDEIEDIEDETVDA